MAIALVGYFSTMVTVCAGLMLFLNVVFTAGPFDKRLPQPHPRPQIAQAETPTIKPSRWGPAVNHETSSVEERRANAAADRTSAARAAVEKNKRISMVKRSRMAQYQKEMLARQNDQHSDTAALGYGQEPFSGSLFGPFGMARRF